MPRWPPSTHSPGFRSRRLGWLRAAVLGEGPEDGFDLAVSWAVGGLAFL